MPYLLEDLVIDRVDLVDEGANSAAFIELYKRKEQGAKMDFEEIVSKLKPEHASVVKSTLSALSERASKAEEKVTALTKERDDALKDLGKAKADLESVSTELTKAKKEVETLKAKQSEYCTCDGEADSDGICKVCGKHKKSASFDEEETLKGLPEEVRSMLNKLRMQKEAAEEEVRKAKEAEKTAQAVAKAAELKALPIDNDKLVEVLKNCSEDMIDILTSINAAIEGTVLGEIGKSTSGASSDAWSKIEAKASEIAKRDNITKQKAISVVIKENPELYKEYLQGGAN